MRVVILALSALVAVCSADVSSFGGYSSGPGSSSFGTIPSRNRHMSHNNQRVEVLADNYVPKVYKHVYVHSAPEEEVQAQEPRVIRVPGGDKHVNIIFVKAPSQSSSGQTEVILPDPDEQKNLVYVLLKKDEVENKVKITRPQPKRPSKPEVHFIRYADQAQSSPVHQEPERPSGLYGTPADVPPPPTQEIAAAPVIPSGLYGTPSAEVAPPPKTPAGLYGTPNQ